MVKILTLLTFHVLTSVLFVQDSTQSIIQQIDENKYKVGMAMLNAGEKSVTIPAKINMNKGLIEVLLCTKAGKTHESLLVTDCAPTHLMIGLITLGFNPMINVDSIDTKSHPDSFLIFVEWSNADKSTKRRAEELIWNDATKKPMRYTSWKFKGSPIYPNGQLAAEFEGTLISTYEMATILENNLPTRYDDTLYFINEKTAPPVGTEVQLIIQPY